MLKGITFKGAVPLKWGFPGSSAEKQWPPTPALAWKIPWKEEPGGLKSMGPLRVGHD